MSFSLLAIKGSPSILAVAYPVPVLAYVILGLIVGLQREKGASPPNLQTTDQKHLSPLSTTEGASVN